MHTRTIAISLAVSAVALVAPASANTDADAVGEAVLTLTTDHYRAWTISKLTTWKVGPKCRAKILAPAGRVLDLTSRLPREIAGYAKQVTGDDWATIEGAGTSEKKANKAKVEPMITAFRQKFSLAISIDGDDCDDSHDPLWMQYVMHAVEAVNAHPPAAGKAFIVIDVSSKQKKFSITTSKDGATFKIAAPKDIAAPKWQDELGRVFTAAARKK